MKNLSGHEWDEINKKVSSLIKSNNDLSTYVKRLEREVKILKDESRNSTKNISAIKSTVNELSRALDTIKTYFRR